MKVFHCFVSRVRFLAALFALIGVTVPYSAAIAAIDGPESSAKSITPDVYVRDVQVHVDTNGITGSFRIHNMEDAVVGGIDYIVNIISPFPELAPDELIGDDPFVYSHEYVPANISMEPMGSEVFMFTHDLPPLPSQESDYRIRIQLVTANGRNMGWDDQDVVIHGSVDAFALVDPLMVIADSTDPYVAEMEEIMIDAEQGDPLWDDVVIIDDAVDRSEVLYDIQDMMDIEAPLHRSEWDPLEGVNVDPGAEVMLQSHIANITNNQLDGNIQLSFRRDLTSTTEFDVTKSDFVSLRGGREETVNTSFAMPTEPGAYEIFLTVVDEHDQRIGTIAEFRVVVRGPSASITGVTVTDVSLSAGEPVVLDVNFIGPADRETVTTGSLEVTMLDDGVSAGVSRSNVELDMGIQTATTRIVLDRTISGTPAARIVIRDAENNILDTYEIEFDREVMLAALSDEPTVTEESQRNIALAVIIGILALAAILSAAFFIRRGFTPPSALLMFVLVLCMSIGWGGYSRIQNAEAYHSHYLPMMQLWRSQGKSVSRVEAKDWGHAPWEAVGTSMRVTRLHRTGSGSNAFLHHTISLRVNKPIPGIDNHRMVIGNQVDYEAQVDYTLPCFNRYLHYNAWVHAADGGGHYRTHREGSWDEVAALYPFGQGFTHHTRRSRTSGPMKGRITIRDNHISQDGKLTLWSDVWVRIWHERDGDTVDATKHYSLMMPFLFTQFSGLTPPPPTPRVTLSANPESVTAGGVSELSWTVQNVDSCVALSSRSLHRSPGWRSGSWVPDWQTANVAAPPSGSKQVRLPLETEGMDYLLTLRCQGPGGAAWDSVVMRATPHPRPVANLTADSTNIPYNTSTTLRWSSEHATYCEFSSGLQGERSLEGHESTGNITGNTTYRFRCHGLGGWSLPATVTVNVGDPPALAPVVVLWADDPVVPYGGSTMIRWTSENTDSCEATDGDWSGNRSIIGDEYTGSITNDVSYELTCVGPGGSSTGHTSVSVEDPDDLPPRPTNGYQERP